jgi:hypothetical protein
MIFQVRGATRDLTLNRERATAMMREGLTNAGKKETRQINQILDKEVKEGRDKARDVEGRTAAKEHQPRGKKVK